MSVHEPVEAVGTATGCHVYGVIGAGATRVPELRGVGGDVVEYVEHAGLCAVVGAVPLDRTARSADLVAHAAVLDALAQQGPVVPVRFGSVLDDRDEVVTGLLTSGHDRFTDLLEQLRGTIQLNLRAGYDEEQVLSEVVAADDGIAELRRRTRDLPAGTWHPHLVRLGEAVSRAVDGLRGTDSAALLDRVRPLVVAVSERPGAGLGHVLDCALLMAEDRVADLEDALESLAEAVHPRIRLRLTGPTAPYDFVGEDAWG